MAYQMSCDQDQNNPQQKQLAKNKKWSTKQTENYLQTATIPIRLSFNNNGYPVLVSLWFKYENKQLFCVTHKRAKIVELIKADPRCAFEVSSNSVPYMGVRGQGLALLHTDDTEALLQFLIEKYLADHSSKLANWLLGRVAEEQTIEIAIERMSTWDYSERMGGPGK